jgi:hypothetical protein
VIAAVAIDTPVIPGIELDADAVWNTIVANASS